MHHVVIKFLVMGSDGIRITPKLAILITVDVHSQLNLQQIDIGDPNTMPMPTCPPFQAYLTS